MNSKPLRRALLGDAIFETVCAAIFILGANTLAAWTGWQFPLVFVVAGVGLAVVAGLLYWMLRQAQINLPLARIVILLNVVFAIVGGVVLVIFWTSLADGARWLISIIAALVGIFAALEYVGLRALKP